MIADNLQKNLSWRGEVAYFRKKQPDGTEKWKSLGQLSKDDARRIVKHMLQRLNADDLMEKLEMIGTRGSLSKLHEILKAYDLFTQGIAIDPVTVRSCKACFKRIVRVVHGESFDVDGASSEILKPSLLTDFSAAMIAERKATGELERWDKEKLEAQLATAARSVRSSVQQARALFSAEARRSAPYRELVLPDLTEFLEMQVGASTVVAYDPPAPEVLQRIRTNSATLKQEDPNAWLAMMLEVNGGLRRSSAVEAKWDWFLERGLDDEKKPIVYLDVRVAKGGNSLVRFDADLYAEMKALRADLTGYIIPGADPAMLAAAAEKDRARLDRKARLAVFDRLLAWLRSQGLKDRRQPNHELRKWFGDQMYITHGAAAGQDALGHSSEKLFKTVYAQRRTKHSLRVI